MFAWRAKGAPLLMSLHNGEANIGSASYTFGMPFLEVAGGAVVGGGVSLVTTLLVESRKTKAELAREDRHQQRELLKGFRLLESECRCNLATLTVIKSRENGPWFPPDLPMITDAWKAYESTLALHPDQELWRAVNTFYVAMWAAAEVANQEDKAPTKARENLDRAYAMAEAATVALQQAINQSV